MVLRAGDGGANPDRGDRGKAVAGYARLSWAGASTPKDLASSFSGRFSELLSTEHMRPAVAEIVSRMELSIDDIDRFICHPGGTKVIRALEHAFSLHQGALDHEREVIADYGNMSSPTVSVRGWNARARGSLPPRSLLTALGPGFTAS